MKKFILIVCLLFGTMAYTNAATNAGKITIENVCEISKNICENSTPATLNLNYGFSELKSMLNLNYAQSRDLHRLQKDITRTLNTISNIEDDAERNQRFSEMIRTWRRLSHAYIIYNTFDSSEIEDAKTQFKLYWAVVNRTLMTSGMLDANSMLKYIKKENA